MSFKDFYSVQDALSPILWILDASLCILQSFMLLRTGHSYMTKITNGHTLLSRPLWRAESPGLTVWAIPGLPLAARWSLPDVLPRPSSLRWQWYCIWQDGVLFSEKPRFVGTDIYLRQRSYEQEAHVLKTWSSLAKLATCNFASLSKSSGSVSKKKVSVQTGSQAEQDSASSAVKLWKFQITVLVRQLRPWKSANKAHNFKWNVPHTFLVSFQTLIPKSY